MLVSAQGIVSASETNKFFFNNKSLNRNYKAFPSTPSGNTSLLCGNTTNERTTNHLILQFPVVQSPVKCRAFAPVDFYRCDDAPPSVCRAVVAQSSQVSVCSVACERSHVRASCMFLLSGRTCLYGTWIRLSRLTVVTAHRGWVWRL